MIIFNGNSYDELDNSSLTKEEKLDTLKLKKLLHKLGFKLTSIGMVFIIEELSFFFDNNLDGFSLLKEAYSISAQMHGVELKNVQWAVESAISSMLRFSNVEFLKSIFFWYTSNQVITPREFMSTMILYLEEHKKEYSKDTN